MNRQGTELERMPPQDVVAEQSVLGACLISRDAIDEAREILSRGDEWYYAPHKVIWDAIVALADAGVAVDQITLCDALQAKGKLDESGGLSYIAKLAAEIVTASNIAYHARIVHEKGTLRSIIELNNAMMQRAYAGGEQSLELLEDHESRLRALTESGEVGLVDYATVIGDTLAMIEKAFQNKGKPSGIRSGFAELDRLTGGFRPGNLIVLAARPKMGKCLGKGTKLLMFDGHLKAVEDVVVGDTLMGPDSTPRVVLSTTQGRGQMFRIKQTYGIGYRANADHILALRRSKTEGTRAHGDYLEIPVATFSGWGPGKRDRYKGFKVHVDFPEKPLPVEPYFLGVWLGDGTTASVTVTNSKPEIRDYMAAYADRLGLSFRDRPTPRNSHALSITDPDRRTQTNSLQGKLRQLGVIGDKHIPHQFFANSRANRLELLAGLLDTDGHMEPSLRGYEVVQKSERLARDIKLLADSLGFKTSIRSKTATIRSIGFSGQVFRVLISGDVECIPCKVPSRRVPDRARPQLHYTDHHHSGLSVTPDGVDDYYGFTLDRDGLFLLEDMTVTHNSAMALRWADRAAQDGVTVAIFSMEMDATEFGERHLAMNSRVPGMSLATGNLEDEDWLSITRAAGRLAALPIYVDHRPARTVPQIGVECRRLQRAKGLGMVIVDYLQLLTPSGRANSREQEVAAMSRGLKNLAMELKVPVICLSQLSRKTEEHPFKRPLPSDLRESGAIEQDADSVILLYRAEAYGFATFTYVRDGIEYPLESAGMAEIILGLQRHGRGGSNVSILARWDSDITLFSPYTLELNREVPVDIPPDEPGRSQLAPEDR